MDTKTCFSCGKEKPLSEFYENKSSKDGRLNKCKECTRLDVYTREREHPDVILAGRIRTCSKNPTKYNAHKVIEAAINAGALAKPDYCMGCGIGASEARIEAHHHDYSKPLDVVWVCTRCHRRLDANRRTREGRSPYGTSRAVVMLVDGAPACRFDSIADASASVGASQSSIKQCLSGKSKTCAGFGWEYE